MSKGLNKLQIIGHVGGDVESFTTPATALAKFSVATSHKYKAVVETEWHRVVAFGKLAAIIVEHVRKGDRVYVEGRLKTSSYEKNGETRYSTDLIANEIIMLSASKSTAADLPPTPVEDDDIPF